MVMMWNWEMISADICQSYRNQKWHQSHSSGCGQSVVGGVTGSCSVCVCSSSDVYEGGGVTPCHGRHGLPDGSVVRPQPHCHQLDHHGEYWTWTQTRHGPKPGLTLDLDLDTDWRWSWTLSQTEHRPGPAFGLVMDLKLN